MHTPLLVFEFLGTTELLVIAVVALILFGPRKLPEIGRTVGKGLAEFRRASEDFKRTWEYEVEVERSRPAADPAPAVAAADTPAGGASLPAYGAAAGEIGGVPPPAEQTVARGAAEEDERGAADPTALSHEHAWDVATGRAAGRAANDDELNAS